PREEPFDVEIIGAANVGDHNVAHVATPADDLMQAFAYHHLVPAKELKVCLAGRGATLRPLSRPPVQLAAGGTTHVEVALPPAVGRSIKNVHVELADGPPGVGIKQSSLGTDTIDI